MIISKLHIFKHNIILLVASNLLFNTAVIQNLMTYIISANIYSMNSDRVEGSTRNQALMVGNTCAIQKV